MKLELKDCIFSWSTRVSADRTGVHGRASSLLALAILALGCSAQGGQGVVTSHGGNPAGSGSSSSEAYRLDSGVYIPIPEVGVGETSPGCKDYTVCCGNGVKDGAEECDDGNKESNDGCSTACKLEADYICPVPGEPCKSTVACGDRRVSGGEACDDGNVFSDDGCSEDCKTVEPGWDCSNPGVRCLPKCGDGLKKGAEQCDDGNTNDEDGCSAKCTLEPGYACPEEGKDCHKTVCGDKMVEGGEPCDDGNKMPGDGCSPDCKAEPKCEGTDGCKSPCGDGLKLPDEECDDGNTRSGDGCSSECKLEDGWNCSVSTEENKTELSVPIIYRDMLPNTAPKGHPNFEVSSRTTATLGIVQKVLGPDRKPVWNPDVDLDNSQTTNADDFADWWRDSERSTMVLDSLTFVPGPVEGTFVYDHSGTWNRSDEKWTTPPFFPLDGRGNAAPGGAELEYLGTGDDGEEHNFYFTSELRYWFEYMGNETLEFIGDDDVWVFVNGRLAVDIGGVHGALPGSVALDKVATDFGLTKGRVYEIVLFQAERHVKRSSYKLTIAKFNRTRTVCAPSCGDGVVNGSEECDDGKNNSDTAYGGCTSQCTWGPRCGDGKVDVTATITEECDNGDNTSQPYGSAGGCAPGCRKSHYCGDGIVDSGFGEGCDEGAKNGTKESWCRSDCILIVP